MMNGLSFSVEGCTNKGILFVVVKNGDQYDIVINAHLKSNVGEELRRTALRVMAQALSNYTDELAQEGISIHHVYLGADLNITDQDEYGKVTNERSSPDNSFMFEGLFPNKPVETWLTPGPLNPEKPEQNTPAVQPKVTFDHAAVYEHKSKPGRSLSQYHMHTQRLDDKGERKADHAPVLVSWKKLKTKQPKITKEKAQHILADYMFGM